MIDEQLLLPGDEKEYYETYFIKIEALFAALRGRSLLLSPTDYQLARSWFDAGIPLSCVLRGIRSAYFKKLADAADDDEAEIRSLSFCKWAVKKEWKEYRQVDVEPAEEPAATASEEDFDAAQVLEGFVFDLRKAVSTAYADGETDLVDALLPLLDELTRLQEDVAAGSESQDTEALLAGLDATMLNAAVMHLSQERLKKLQRSVDRKLSSYAGRMPAAQLETTRNHAIQNKVRVELKLPRLTLHTITI